MARSTASPDMALVNTSASIEAWTTHSTIVIVRMRTGSALNPATNTATASTGVVLMNGRGSALCCVGLYGTFSTYPADSARRVHVFNRESRWQHLLAVYCAGTAMAMDIVATGSLTENPTPLFAGHRIGNTQGMTRAKRLVVAAGFFFILATSMGFAYGAIGQEIATDGTLVEPFALIPLTYLATLIGVVLLVLSGFLALGAHRRPATASASPK